MLISAPGIYQINEKQVNIETSGEVVLLVESNLELNINENNQLNLNLINQNAESIIINSVVNKNLTIGMVNSNSKPLDLKFNCQLVKEYATLKLVNTGVSNNQQNYFFKVDHLARNTASDISNYGVVVADANYNCEIVGEIKKGFKGSEAFQSSRVLTSGDVNKVRVLPILNMEENDIKAKHACTIGRLEEQQRFYMASRGLNEDQIIKLVAFGYLSNVLSLISNNEIKDMVENEIINQVEELCLI